MPKNIEKVNLNSKDIKSEQVEKLKKIFPEIISDGKINFEQLKATLGEDIEDSKERFGMTWAGKSKCFRIIQDPATGTLKPSRKESVNFDTTENLFIEGDNLEVLKLLQKSYYEKVKMIYIDPPYNTGKDFVYPDNFGQQLDEYLKITGQVDDDGKKLSTNTDSSGRFHSDWMNMMYPRLFLARNLLKEDGAIFISIDDNEVANLRKICDEVFGEYSFVACLVWKRRASSALAENKVSTDHEYVLVYSKSKNFSFIGESKDFANYTNPDNDPRGDWVKGDLTVGMNASMRPNQAYDLVNPDTGKKYPFNPNRVWAYIPTSMNKLIREKRIIFPDENTKKPMLKRFKSELKDNVNPLSTLMSDVGINTEGTKEIQNLLGGNYFSYSKPVSLVKKMISQVCTKNDVVLDFFAGSGTIAQAILELNLTSEITCNFICVQLPEPLDDKSEAFKTGFKTIADISKERIRRVIKKIEKESKQQKLLGERKLDLGFRVFKLDRSNFKKWDNSTEELQTSLSEHVEQIKKTANPEDVLYEILIKDGFELTTKIEKTQLKGKDVFSIEKNLLLICLDEKLDLDLFKEMKKLDPQLVIVLDKGFKNNDQLKTNAVQTLGKNSDEDYILRTI